MAKTETDGEDSPAKRSKKPLILGVVGAIVLGGGAFFALYSGMIMGGDDHSKTAADGHGGGDGHGGESLLSSVAFVPVDPLIITLGPEVQGRHLRFQAQLEVTPAYQQEVTLLMPRVLDVLNSYLRAVEADEFERPTALITLRAQMLRRVQLVTGQDRVRDLLITEFVLN
ncbi:flagellar basal body-associated FliL family protein [Rhodovulum euryhalinum]|uniref:Flagellar protein FliL n=1 Tax=Rhodovulum euryhalinum TaxID=35805 RepID=A0A4R2KQY9_9RHOB|nr:flagellar basal body-associated FliL family protein [Rhodovulum euryhalinum]TCO73376.1 flagellar FliL protein [Rhodovulum euryhalinum]